MQAEVQPVIQILGAQNTFVKPPVDTSQLVQEIRKGISAKSVDHIVQRFKLTHAELSSPLGVSESTIKRRHQREALSPAVSDRLVSVAGILASAKEILGDEDKASRWLHKPNRALGGDTPLSRLDTHIGFAQVREILQRIDHGLFA